MEDGSVVSGGKVRKLITVSVGGGMKEADSNIALQIYGCYLQTILGVCQSGRKFSVIVYEP